MDPNATLEELRKLVTKIHTDYQDTEGNGIDQDDADQLASMVAALDRWISRGGFLPKAWNHSNQKKGL
jgi:hypothetical protein